MSPSCSIVGVHRPNKRQGSGVEKLVYRRVLARVAALNDGAARVAHLLGVSSTLVTRWIEGRVPMPVDIFLKCVDLLHHEVNHRRVPPPSRKPDLRRHR
jgi:hypothetical protein